MTPEILQWLSEIRRQIPDGASILEIGAAELNGSARSILAEGAAEYLGVDNAAGPGVDLVTDAETMHLNRQFDVVVCCETLEHTRNPLAVIERMKAHLKSGGLLIVTTPGNGVGEHFCPRDYYRFMPNFFEDILFSDMEIIRFDQPTGAGQSGPTMMGIGRKP